MSEDNLLRTGGAENMELLSSLQSYLASLCSVLILLGQDGAAVLNAALMLPESGEAMLRFALTSECSVLLVERNAVGVKVGSDVRMPTTNSAVAYLALIKAREMPLDAKQPIPNQTQVISMTVDAEGDASSDEVNQSFFSRLHQCTRHYYAPLARSARNNKQVHHITDSGSVLAILLVHFLI
jgi:hypothetical protein